MRKWIIALAFLLLPVLAQAQITLPANPAGQDPCVSAAKIVIPITISSATTTQLVALSAGKAVYVCSGIIDLAGSITTADTIQFEYGTGATCGTGTQVITGAMIGSLTAGTPTIVPLGTGAGTVFGTIASNALCAVSTGTTVSITGFITVVQL